ncbi:MAG TPA: hypothetical protein ACFE0H_00835 [Elainellaceae cyanobacterium]|jgi:hypothetical protein
MIQKIERAIAPSTKNRYSAQSSLYGFRQQTQTSRQEGFSEWVHTSANWLYMLWLALIVLLMGITVGGVYFVVSTSVK